MSITSSILYRESQYTVSRVNVAQGEYTCSPHYLHRFTHIKLKLGLTAEPKDFFRRTIDFFHNFFQARVILFPHVNVKSQAQIKPYHIMCVKCEHAVLGILSFQAENL